MNLDDIETKFRKLNAKYIADLRERHLEILEENGLDKRVKRKSDGTTGKIIVINDGGNVHYGFYPFKKSGELSRYQSGYICSWRTEKKLLEELFEEFEVVNV